MCQDELHCEHETNAKGCALKHMAKARELLAQSRYEDADTMLSRAEEHLKEL